MSPLNIGFISTRFHGTDGVSLETAKWVHVLENEGHQVFWYAGKLDTPEERSFLCEKAFFDHPEIRELQSHLFGTIHRPRERTNQIHCIKEELKNSLYAFIDKFQLDLLVPQNILAIPMHVPLGAAFTEVVAETRIPVLAHHHDFAWERDRFSTHAVPDYMAMAFPPRFSGRFHNVVINSSAQRDLALRRGLSSTLIPNVLDFENPPPPSDGYEKDFRNEFEISPRELIVLQPTRVVNRKGIEHAIELVRQLQTPSLPVSLIVSHDAGDEGMDYLETLKDRACESKIRMIFIGSRVRETRGVDEFGRKCYSLADVYRNADLVTYPSIYEGFGNAFLEAVYFRKPLLVNRYSIFIRDIEPFGFKVIGMDGVITNQVVTEVAELMKDPERREAWAEQNYECCRHHFSYSVLRKELTTCLVSLFGN